jgi:hypothetical protein
MTQPVITHALSIKQPWAALIVAGRKTIEIRTWPTRVRGGIFIHAGKIADDRPEAWTQVDTPEVKSLTEFRGGIIGTANLRACRMYRSQKEFAIDQAFHLNESTWFRPPILYGFEFFEMQMMPFVPVKGQTLFFSVKGLHTS